MNHSAFCDILDGLNRGESPALVLSVNDMEYLRRFTKTDRLILLGGGHVSLDVYRLARTLDFDVICVDDRPMFANSTRFPEATVICDDFVSAIHNLHISESDYVCVLTRGHRWDAECRGCPHRDWCEQNRPSCGNGGQKQYWEPVPLHNPSLQVSYLPKLPQRHPPSYGVPSEDIPEPKAPRKSSA